MKKMKVFFVAAGLLVATVGVFASKSQTDSYVVYGYKAGVYETFASALTSGMDLTKSGLSTQINVVAQNGQTYALEYYDVTNPSTVGPKAIYVNF